MYLAELLKIFGISIPPGVVFGGICFVAFVVSRLAKAMGSTQKEEDIASDTRSILWVVAIILIMLYSVISGCVKEEVRPHYDERGNFDFR